MHEHIDQAPSVTRRAVGHLAWAYEGLAEFEGRAASFLVEGHVRGERQVFIADDPKASLWPKGLIERGELLILSTNEVYGSARIVDAVSQRAAFEESLAEALTLGYTGLCVAADNTSLTSDTERLEAWMCWEDEADLLMQSKPITGLCAFDRTRSDAETLKAVMGVHQAPIAF